MILLRRRQGTPRPRQVRTTFAIRFYRIYDTGKEIDISRLEEALSSGHTIARSTFTRVKPKSIAMDMPPLLLRLPQVVATVGGLETKLGVIARVYDIGAVSICFLLEDMEAPAGDLRHAALRSAGQDGLEPVFLDTVDRIRGILGPLLEDFSIDPGFFEDYTIFIADRSDPAIDPVVVLLGEDRTFSPQTREDTLKNSHSYGTDDLTILSWDTALLISSEPPWDILELIEFANVQALEFRYYDRKLTRQMERMYDDIEDADRKSFYIRLRQYHRIMSRLMQDQAEISDITEKVDNLIKVTEDVYYARVYATALHVLRISQWRDGLNRKIGIIRKNYEMLSDEVHIQHSNFLELVIILLIAFEIAIFIGQIFWIC
ncbi:MAG: hypothetical protein IPI71_01435 [Methanolinea sp.]|nr:MAG: hypothetical protein IPI71_01435 [Methanolinea sp.]